MQAKYCLHIFIYNYGALKTLSIKTFDKKTDLIDNRNSKKIQEKIKKYEGGSKKCIYSIESQ